MEMDDSRVLIVQMNLSSALRDGPELTSESK